MEKLTTTFSSGLVSIPLDVQHSLGLTEGMTLSLSLGDGGLFLKPEPVAMTLEEARAALDRFRELLKDGPDLEEELYKMRREEEATLQRKWG